MLRLCALLFFLFAIIHVGYSQLSSTRIHEIEEFAMQTPDSVSRNISGLVRHLIMPAENDEEKARLIYTWIATHIKYDQSAINAGRTADFAANLVLKKKKAVCFGISLLFEAMALEAGLEARTIIGYAKGTSSETKKLKNPNHAWNVVYYNDAWHLLDATWGSGYLIQKGKKTSLKRIYDSFWFDTDPRVFVFTHLPDIQKWKLLDGDITLPHFKKSPLITQSYIRAGFSIDSVYVRSLKDPVQHVPKFYSTKEEWRIVDSPGPDALKKNKQYYFSIQTEAYEKVIVTCGNEQYMVASTNGIFNIAFPADGKLVSFYFFQTIKSSRGELAMTYQVKK